MEPPEAFVLSSGADAGQHCAGRTEHEREDHEHEARRNALRCRSRTKAPERELAEHDQESEPEDLRQRPPFEPRQRRRADRRCGERRNLPCGGGGSRRPPRNHRQEKARRDAGEKSFHLRHRMKHRDPGTDDPQRKQQPRQHARPGQGDAEGKKEPIRFAPQQGIPRLTPRSRPDRQTNHLGRHQDRQYARIAPTTAFHAALFQRNASLAREQPPLLVAGTRADRSHAFVIISFAGVRCCRPSGSSWGSRKARP